MHKNIEDALRDLEKKQANLENFFARMNAAVALGILSIFFLVSIK